MKKKFNQFYLTNKK